MAQEGVTGPERLQAVKGATLIVPTSFDADPGYTKVTLMNGTYYLRADNLQLDDYLVVRLETDPAFGDINRDGLEDAAVVFSVGNNDVGYGIYLTTLLDIDGDAQALQPVRLENSLSYTNLRDITVHDNLVRMIQVIPKKFPRKRKLWVFPGDPDFLRETLLNREFIIEGNVLYALDQLPVTQIVKDNQLLLSSASNYVLYMFTRDGVARLDLFNRGESRLEIYRGSLILQATSQGVAYSYQETDIEPSVQIQVGFSGEQTILVNGSPVEGERITGTVTNQSPDALPPNAVVEIVLEEISPTDAVAMTLASQTLLWGSRQRSLPFELRYNRDDINPQLTYALRAKVTLDGRLEFPDTSGVPVLTQNNPMTDVEVIVGSV